MFDWIADPTTWLGLLTLIALEIVLGVDNLIFIAILADRLPARQRDRARLIGLFLALFMRLALLASISWLVTLTRPVIAALGFSFSGRDLILLGGGLFLLFKATTELHERLEGGRVGHQGPRLHAAFWAVVAQIVLIDAVFSLDSVITAVGMVDELPIMMIAVAVAIAVMMLASRPLTAFVSAHPTVVVLCLGFLLMIGFSLVMEGFHVHVPKGYLYAAIAFSVLIETFNQIARRRARQRVLAHGRQLRARVADTVVGLLGASTPARHTEDEVAALAGASAAASVFQSSERDMVRGVLGLAERPVRAVMRPRKEVVWLDLNQPPERLRERILASGYERYPLARGSLDRLVGVGRAAALLRALERKQRIDASDCAPPLIFRPQLSALQALQLFKERREHFGIVMTEANSVCGVVSVTDVLEAIAGELPEMHEPSQHPGDTGTIDGQEARHA
jgi:predicted tellurium resistance membrane protein TerC